MRWDDYLRRFAENELESAWYAACLNDDFPQHEDAFCVFHSTSKAMIEVSHRLARSGPSICFYI